MKKLSKIKLIELPKKSVLDNEEMSNVKGGEPWDPDATCSTYTSCIFAADKCYTWSEDAPCNGQDTLLCDTYKKIWW